MRLWSLHPSYLDAKGLVAAWREALLAQKVLAGETRGYRNHPQLERFRAAPDPMAAIGAFLQGLHAEAGVRGYSFDGEKIRCGSGTSRVSCIGVTRGQIAYEAALLASKLEVRAPELRSALTGLEGATISLHPLFFAIDGPVASWERTIPGIG